MDEYGGGTYADGGSASASPTVAPAGATTSAAAVLQHALRSRRVDGATAVAAAAGRTSDAAGASPVVASASVTCNLASPNGGAVALAAPAPPAAAIGESDESSTETTSGAFLGVCDSAAAPCRDGSSPHRLSEWSVAALEMVALLAIGSRMTRGASVVGVGMCVPRPYAHSLIRCSTGCTDSRFGSLAGTTKRHRSSAMMMDHTGGRHTRTQPCRMSIVGLERMGSAGQQSHRQHRCSTDGAAEGSESTAAR